MLVIKDGAFTGLVELFISNLGLLIALYSYNLMHAGVVGNMFLYFSIGIFVAAIGGYSAQAAVLKVRPFGRHTWPKLKNTKKHIVEIIFEKMLLITNISSFIMLFWYSSLKIYFNLYVHCISAYLFVIFIVVFALTAVEIKINRSNNCSKL